MNDAVIFTPDNEPYLGRQLLQAFDQIIVVTLETSARVANWTRSRLERSDLQKAAVITAPQAISLALAIRELLRQGYLFPAKVMLRPLIERVVTILYVTEKPAAADEWMNGKRPVLAHMMNYLSDRWFAEKDPSRIGGVMTKPLNSLTHGDLQSAEWNTISMNDDRLGFGVSKSLNDANLCDEICADVVPWLVMLSSMMIKIVPDAHPRAEDVAPGTTVQ